ncbi:MAG: cytochrome c oxidase subunit II [Syntrophobacteraceae bacterium]|nr:cytochrome c oxidase subunit II [Syntrophobacteraceae bacterium]
MDAFTSVLKPGTKEAGDILSAFYIVLGIATLIFIIVAGLVVYAVIKFRRRKGREPGQLSEKVWLEVLWITVPLVIVIGLFILAVRVMLQVNPPSLGHKPDLTVVAHQWWWELHYPPSGVTAANEIHLPVGKHLLLRFESADVIHGFWVPSFGQKIDVIPGHPNTMWLTITRPGLYLGTCHSFCGMGHAHMGIRVFAQSPEDFSAWLAHQSRPASPPSSVEAAQGAELFREKNCVNCHSISGFMTTGREAPDLTHVGSRTTLAAGTLANTPENMAKWLKDPQAVKMGVLMPEIGLEPDQIKALSAYLEGLK